MSIPEEFDEIIRDLRGATFSGATYEVVRAQLRKSAMATVQAAKPTEMMDDLADLLLMTFYVGREHHARGYEALADRDTGSMGQDEAGVPDTVEALLDPDLRRFHVEFHCDVLARNGEEAIQKSHGDDWRVEEMK